MCIIAPSGNTAPSEVVSQRRQTVGKTVSDLMDPRFRPFTSRSKVKRVTVCSTDLLYALCGTTSIIIFEPFKCTIQLHF